MSILDRNDIPNPVPPAKMAANRLINMTRQTYQQMVQSFNQGAQVFWQNGTGASPVEIAAELGCEGGESSCPGPPHRDETMWFGKLHLLLPIFPREGVV